MSAARSLIAVVVGSLVGLALTILPPMPPAHAGTTFTWTGEGTDSSWSNPGNWEPPGEPQDGDSVVIDNPENGRSIQVLLGTSVALKSLTISQRVPGTGVHLRGPGHVTVTDTLNWNGGDIATGLTLAAGATGRIANDEYMYYGNADGQVFTVNGTLSVADRLPLGAARDFVVDDDIVVGPTGHLVFEGFTTLATLRCCSPPVPTLENHGTIELVGSSVVTVKAGLEQHGVLRVPPGDYVTVTGPALSEDATYAGGGRIFIEDNPYPYVDPTAPGGVRNGFNLLGTQALADGTTLAVCEGGDVAGTGNITGDGEITMCGGEWQATTALGEGVHLDALSGLSAITAESGHPEGITGHLTASGRFNWVAAEAELQVGQYSTLTLPVGVRLDVPNGATLSSDGCCGSGEQVVVNGQLRVGGGEGNRLGDEDPDTDPAYLRWIDLGGRGKIIFEGTTQWSIDRDHHFTGRLVGEGEVIGDLPVGNSVLFPTGPLDVSGTLRFGTDGTWITNITGAQQPKAAKRVDVASASLAGQLVVRTAKDYPRGSRVTILTYDTKPSTTFTSVDASGWKVKYTDTGIVLVAR